MSKGFSMTDILNSQSKSGAVEKPMDIILIPLDKLVASETNFYELRNIDELADSILNEGLHQPIIVVRDNSNYRVISGHRRMTALKQLAEEYPEEFKMAPCIIKTYENAIVEQMALINSNATARVLSDYEKMLQAVELKKLFQAAEENGLKIKGKKRTLIADTLSTSETQIARFETIDRHLSKDFLQAFKNGNIGFSVASEIATLPQEKQEELYKVYQSQNNQISLSEVKSAKNDNKEPTVKRDKKHLEVPKTITALAKLLKSKPKSVSEEQELVSYFLASEENLQLLIDCKEYILNLDATCMDKE